MTDPSTADVQAELKEYLNSKNINRCVRGELVVTSVSWICEYRRIERRWTKLISMSPCLKHPNMTSACLRLPIPCPYNSLFIHIVERLLIEKPDNPIGFIVEYLAKRYPDETRAVQVGHSMGQRGGSTVSIASAVSR